MNKLGKLFTLFCTIAACIFLCSAVFILICWGKDSNISLSYIFGVFLIALISSILYILLLGEKELSKNQTIIFRTIYLLVINLLVLLVGYKLRWFDPSNLKMVIGMEITIISVFVILNLFEYISGLNEANRLNDILTKRFQEQSSED